MRAVGCFALWLLGRVCGQCYRAAILLAATHAYTADVREKLSCVSRKIDGEIGSHYCFNSQRKCHCLLMQWRNVDTAIFTSTLELRKTDGWMGTVIPYV